MNNISSAIAHILAAHRPRAASYIGASVLILGALGTRPALAADPACLQMVGDTCVVSSQGAVGTPAKSPDDNGHPGGPGGAGNPLTVTLTEQTVYNNSNAGLTSPFQVTSTGGAGAQGSDATKGIDDKDGGAGGPGGVAGNISVTTQGSQIGGASFNAATALLITSAGGAGGATAAGASQGSPGAALGVGGNSGTANADLDGSGPLAGGNGRSLAPRG